MFFRLLIWGALFYFAFKLMSSFLRVLEDKKSKVRGSRKGNPPLDLSNNDVEDADFEDIQ